MNMSKEHFEEVADNWNNKVWARDKDFASAIVKIADLRGDEVALYVGVGTGEIASKFNVADMTGIDISPNMLKKNQVLKKHRLIVGDVYSIPFLDNTFDLVFSRNLLKHTLNPLKAIDEMKRVCKVGGLVYAVESCVMNPKDKEYPNFCVQQVEPNHPSFMTYKEIQKLFEDNHLHNVQNTIYDYRSTWLRKWCESCGADDDIRMRIYNKYKKAPASFIRRQEVKLLKGDINSIIYWSMIRGRK